MMLVVNSSAKGVKCANYHLNRLLSSSAWSSLTTLIISAESSEF